jgi:hypothetical protein
MHEALGSVPSTGKRKNLFSQEPMLTPIILAAQEARDQEDQSSMSAWANSSREPILKKPITKKGW